MKMRDLGALSHQMPLNAVRAKLNKGLSQRQTKSYKEQKNKGKNKNPKNEK